MNRRVFLRKAAAVPIGLAAFPVLSLMDRAEAAYAPPPVIDRTQCSVEEAIQDVFDHLDGWYDDLPGVDFKELMLRRLVEEKLGRPYEEVAQMLAAVQKQ